MQDDIAFTLSMSTVHYSLFSMISRPSAWRLTVARVREVHSGRQPANDDHHASWLYAVSRYGLLLCIRVEVHFYMQQSTGFEHGTIGSLAEASETPSPLHLLLPTEEE